MKTRIKPFLSPSLVQQMSSPMLATVTMHERPVNAAQTVDEDG